MKTFRPVSALLFMIAALTVSADDFCMDCTQRPASLGADDVRIVASCCMAVDGHCYEKDVVVDANVGSGCLVSEPTPESGSTYCQSNTNDKGCPTGGGGSGTPGTKKTTGTECVYDATGWCDASCGSCTWT